MRFVCVVLLSFVFDLCVAAVLFFVSFGLFQVWFTVPVFGLRALFVILLFVVVCCLFV